MKRFFDTRLRKQITKSCGGWTLKKQKKNIKTVCITYGGWTFKLIMDKSWGFNYKDSRSWFQR